MLPERQIYDDTADMRAWHAREGMVNIAGLAHERGTDLQAEATGRTLGPAHNCPHPIKRREKCHVRELGDYRLKKFHPFCRHLSTRRRMPGDIATRSRQSGSEAFADRIPTEGHNDRDRPRCLLDGSYRWGRRGDDHVDVEANDLRRQIGKCFELPVRISRVDQGSLALDVAEVAQTLAKSFHVGRISRSRERR